MQGGDRFDELRSALFGRYSGEPGDIDGVIVTRQRPDDLSPRATEDTDRVEAAIIDGMRNAGPGQVPIVGVERTDADESSIEFFADHGAASVDNADQLPGRVALVYALDGAEGDFGVKEPPTRCCPICSPRRASGSAPASATDARRPGALGGSRARCCSAPGCATCCAHGLVREN